MQVALTNSDLANFVDEQIKSGLYSTATEVIEAGLARLMLDPVPSDLDDDYTLAAIARAEAEFNRGEDRPFEEVARELRAKCQGSKSGR